MDKENPDPPAQTLSEGEARQQAREISSEVLDLIGIKNGKVTQPGPRVSPCGEDEGDLFRTRHPWSVYGVPEEELEKGFARLKDGLLGKGWKIVNYGPNNSKAQSLELTADHGTKRFSVNAVLMVNAAPGDLAQDPILAVTVVSGCFQAP